MTAICEICNENFYDNYRKLSHHLRSVHGLNAKEYHDTILKTPNSCNNTNCSKHVNFKKLQIGYLKYCIKSCAINEMDREKATKEYKKNMINKYGVDNPSKIKHVKDKRKKTNIKRYGGIAPICSDVIKSKIKETNIKRYNTDNYMQSETLIEYYKTKYNLILAQNNLKFISDYTTTDNIYDFECTKCGHKFTRYFNTTSMPKLTCPNCNKGTMIENLIKEILNNNNIKFIVNDRNVIAPYELDFYLPEYNIGIECHGLYWHSEQFLKKHTKGNPKHYHLNKLNYCTNAGIELLQFYEDEILNKFDIISGIILSKCNRLKPICYARNTEIKLINNSVANDFLELNHLHGRSSKEISLGAYFDDTLIAVMTFKKSAISRSNYDTWELDRFCTLNNCHIPGIASKLFKYFIKHNPDINKITTYADLRFSVGNLYKQLGFNFIHQSKPNYFYIINKSRKHRFSFRKSILKSKLSGFDNNLTEYNNMLNHGIDRIWDCGHLKFEWNR
jgi:putative FmdB family regulatory protein